MPHAVRNFSGSHTADSYWTWMESAKLFHVYFLKIIPVTDFANMSTLGFTSYHKNVTLSAHSGITFKPSAGLDPTVIETALGKPSNLEMVSVFNSSEITEADLLAGKWNNAKVELWRMNGDDFTMGEEVLFSGVLGIDRDWETNPPQ